MGGIGSDIAIENQIGEPPLITETGVPRETPVSERKKEGAECSFPSPSEPGKRNAASFF